MSENEFMDLTFEEFTSTRTGLMQSTSYKPLHILGHESQADSIDWRQKGAVSEVKNQGQCGSCWAFSTVGALEGLHAVKTGKLVEYSEQALVDCSHNGNQGCNGGLMDYAFEYVEKKGIPTESKYPYDARAERCQNYDSSFKIGGFVDVPRQDPIQMKAALNVQPVSIAVAVNTDFQFYSSGVMDFTCPPNLNHGVLAVGYGHDEELGQDYWLVKNSWGTGWGENGFFRLLRTDEYGPQQCGILESASYPTL